MKNLLHLLIIFLTPITLMAQIDVASPSGHVGIGGITAPVYKLDVDGDTHVRGLNFLLGSDRGLRLHRYNNGVSVIRHYGTRPLQIRNQNSAEIDFFTNNARRMRIYQGGSLRLWSSTAQKFGGGAWTSFSDKRLKRDIQPYEKGLTELLQIRPVSYYYLSDLYEGADSEQHVGVVAQELQRVVPTMIGESELLDEEGEPKASYLSVNPNEFTYMLINAVQEQQEAIDAKDEQIEALSDEVAAMRDEIAELRALVQNSLNGSSSNASQTVELGTAGELFQNEPNPFNETTRIRYTLTRTTQNALLQISDMNGGIIKTIPLDTSRNGEVLIKAQELAAGTYFYTLIVDGKIVSTKQMILTE